MARGINSERNYNFGARTPQKGVTVARKARVVSATDKALCVRVEEGPEAPPMLPGMAARAPRPAPGEEIWVPRSQIHDDSEVYTETGDNSEGRLVVTAWLASQERWG